MNASLSPVVQSDVIVDAPYIFELLDRCRARSVFSQIWNVLRYPIGFFFLVCSVAAFAQQQVGIGFMALLITYLSFYISKLANKVAAHQIRNTCGIQNQRIAIGEDGVQSWSPLNPRTAVPNSANAPALNISWGNMRRVVVFNDGVLFYGINCIYWVPDASLRSPDEAKLLRELVAANTR